MLSFKVNRLCREISEDIIIYGTGCYAQSIYDKFIEFGMEKRVTAFVVTEKTMDQFQGKPVYGIKELELCYKNEAILVAVSEIHRESISRVLEKYSFGQVVYLSDYEYGSNDVWDIYAGKSAADYLLSVTDWCIDNHLEVTDFINNRRDKNEKQIVLIIGMEPAFPRHIKILKALQNKGYICNVLCYADASGKIVEEELDLYNIQVDRCEYFEEMMYKMLQYNPLLYCMEPAWDDCSWGNIILQQKQLFGKVIASRYDIMIDSVGYGFSVKQKEAERSFLEKADGIIWRCYYKDILEKQGLKFQGKSIYFLDYCSGDFGFGCNEIQQEERDDTIKLVMVYSNPSTALLGDYIDSVKGYAVCAKLKDILEKIKGNNCCFHLFSYYVSNEALIECKQLEEDYREFKLWVGYGHKQVLDKLKEYDYGCMLETGGAEIPDMYHINEFTKGIVYKRCAMAKHFDYIESGLPVVSTCPKKQCEELEKTGALIKMNLDTLDIEDLRINKNKYRERLKLAMQELSIENQIERLIQFFDDVVRNVHE